MSRINKLIFKEKNIIKLLKILTSLICMSYIAAAASAEQYPSRPIELIVGFGPGGSSDVIARNIAASMERILNQKIIIINRPGAAGSIGFKAMADAKPNGYTIGIGSLGGLVLSPLCVKNIPYNPLTDFTFVGIIGKVPSVLAVHRDVPVSNYTTFIQEIQRNPNKYNYGAQFCSQNHILLEALKKDTNINITSIMYNTGGQLLIDSLSGLIHVYAETITISTPHLITKNNPEGRLRPLAVVWPNRLPGMPDIPTLTEVGGEEYTSISWYGIIMPANVPKHIVKILSDAVKQATTDSAFSQSLAAVGGQSISVDSTAFELLVQKDINKFKKIMASAQFKID